MQYLTIYFDILHIIVLLIPASASLNIVRTAQVAQQIMYQIARVHTCIAYAVWSVFHHRPNHRFFRPKLSFNIIKELVTLLKYLPNQVESVVSVTVYNRSRKFLLFTVSHNTALQALSFWPLYMDFYSFFISDILFLIKSLGTLFKIDFQLLLSQALFQVS